jgi:KDEL-tailed cysteine endopeptidase
MRFMLLSVLFLACVSAAPVYDDHYLLWANQNGRTLSPERAKIFAQNRAYIVAHNATIHGFEVALNSFADLTVDEFQAVALRPSTQAFGGVADPIIPTSDSVDWRAKGKVTGVHDLALVGCSLPDMMADSLSSAEAITCGAPLVTYSSEELVQCIPGGVACAAGVKDFEIYVKAHGLMTADAYDALPARGVECRLNSTAVHKLPCDVSTWENVAKDDNDALKSAVEAQPVVVALDASSSAFQFYSKGIFSGACDASKLNHAMLAVGYATEETQDGKDFWIVKNNWGMAWGDNGYISILRQSGKGPGACGIAAGAGYPVLKA